MTFHLLHDILYVVRALVCYVNLPQSVLSDHSKKRELFPIQVQIFKNELVRIELQFIFPFTYKADSSTQINGRKPWDIIHQNLKCTV